MAELTILQVVPRLDSGGSEQAAVEIADALTRAGVCALVATEGGRLATAVARAGGAVVTLPMASKNPITLLANARRLARPDRGARGRSGACQKPRAGVERAARRAPDRASRSSPPITAPMAASAPFKNAYNSVMARGDRVIANSRYTADLIAARHHVPPERIRVIYRGVDEAAFDPLVVPPGPVAKLRERWGVRRKPRSCCKRRGSRA